MITPNGIRYPVITANRIIVMNCCAGFGFVLLKETGLHDQVPPG